MGGRTGSLEGGATLIEVMLVLGIATAFIAGGIALYGNAQRGLVARNAVNDLMGGVSEIRSFYANAEDFSGLSSFGVPNPFGGAPVYVRPVGSPSGGTDASKADHAIAIIEGIDEGICVSVVNILNGADNVHAWTASTTTAPSVSADAAATDFQEASAAPCDGTDDHLVLTIAK